MRSQKEIVDEITELARIYYEKRWKLLQELREAEYADITSLTIVK